MSRHSSHMGSPLDWAGADGSQSPIWPGRMTDDVGAIGGEVFGSATRRFKIGHCDLCAKVNAPVAGSVFE
jgi:hypothetical protein